MAYDQDGACRGKLKPEPSDIVIEIRALRERLAELEASIPVATERRSAARQHGWRHHIKIIALVLSAAALGGASVVYGQSAVEALFIRQDGNVGIGTNDPASRLTVVGNVSIGTAAAAPPNGLLVQGAVNAASINATTINLNGQPILADLQGQVNALRGRIEKVEGANQSQSGRIAALESGVKYALWPDSNCPSGWKFRGVVGLIVRKDLTSLAMGPIGGGFNDGWTWFHPSVCSRN